MTHLDIGTRHGGAVTVVGLGGIGGGIALRLAECGREVTGVDVDSARVADWQAQSGGTGATTLDDVDWVSTECVIIAVRTAKQVESVLSSSALRSVLAREASVLVVTTLTPADARRIAGAELSGRRFELPVSGGEARARNGELTGLIAGPAVDDFESALLGEMFASVFTFDMLGQPSWVKLINNTLAAHNALHTAVALSVADDHGIDVGLVDRVITASSGASAAGAALPTLTDNQVDLLIKDADLLRDQLQSWPFTPASLDDISTRVAHARRLLTPTDIEGAQHQ